MDKMDAEREQSTSNQSSYEVDLQAIQTLHALRIGLCKKVEDGSITLPLAVDIFDRVHQIVLKMKKAKEEAEAGPRES